MSRSTLDDIAAARDAGVIDPDTFERLAAISRRACGDRGARHPAAALRCGACALVRRRADRARRHGHVFDDRLRPVGRQGAADHGDRLRRHVRWRAALICGGAGCIRRAGCSSPAPSAWRRWRSSRCRSLAGFDPIDARRAAIGTSTCGSSRAGFRWSWERSRRRCSRSLFFPFPFLDHDHRLLLCGSCRWI